MPSVLFDAVVVPGGDAAVKLLGTAGHALELIKDQHRHAKPILALGAGGARIENAGASRNLPSGDPDPGVLIGEAGAADEMLPAFLDAVAKHRHFDRQTDPPEV